MATHQGTDYVKQINRQTERHGPIMFRRPHQQGARQVDRHDRQHRRPEAHAIGVCDRGCETRRTDQQRNACIDQHWVNQGPEHHTAPGRCRHLDDDPLQVEPMRHGFGAGFRAHTAGRPNHDARHRQPDEYRRQCRRHPRIDRHDWREQTNQHPAEYVKRTADDHAPARFGHLLSEATKIKASGFEIAFHGQQRP
ncbi:MAG: hypothetical protein IPF83_06145 [Rhodanobacteraceae bacterium]|nr:hypothetical protein [Rhodanobacteraceae bacterium]